jgi:hypothetical protein
MTYPPTALLELYDAQARVGAQVISSGTDWPGDPARLARDVGDLIAGLLDAPKRLEKLYTTTWDRLGFGPVAWCVPAGEALFRYWDSLTGYLTAIRDVARALVAAGHAVPQLPGLEEVVAKISGQRQQAYDGWPWFRPEDAEEALAEHARGESWTLEEVFGALSRPDR